jgi:hypothetical protein
MSHSAARPLRPKERLQIWLLVLIERLALTVLRRGPIKKWVFSRVNRALERYSSRDLRERWAELTGDEESRSRLADIPPP